MWRWVGVVTLAGCSQWFGLDSPIISDATGPDALPATCTDVSLACVTPDLLRSCAGPGAIPIDTQCSWGCLAPPHCGRIMPAGGVATADDVAEDPQLVDVSLAAIVIDSDTGRIGTSLDPMAVRSGGTGVHNGIDFQVRGSAGVFRFKSLTIAGAVSGIGSHSIVLVANGAIDVADTIDMRGPCSTNAAGPGGFSGGQRGQNAPGNGGGARGINRDEAGGGGGYGGIGGGGGSGRGR